MKSQLCPRSLPSSGRIPVREESGRESQLGYCSCSVVAGRLLWVDECDRNITPRMLRRDFMRENSHQRGPGVPHTLVIISASPLNTP